MLEVSMRLNTITRGPDSAFRFATELAGRKARRKDWAGLADEMAQAGWFEP